MLTKESKKERKTKRLLWKKIEEIEFNCSRCDKTYKIFLSKDAMDKKINNITMCLFCHPVTTGKYKIEDTQKVNKYMKKWNLKLD